MKTVNLFIAILFLGSLFCNAQEINEEQIMTQLKESFDFEGAETLLLGTWHMGYTSDANKSSYDASLPKRREEIAALALQLAREFKPTKILVEVLPEEQAEMDSIYALYLKDPKKLSNYQGEVGLLAFQIARESGAQLIATDHKMEYNYGRIMQMAQETNNAAVNSYYAQVMGVLQQAAQLEQQATTKQLYRFTNTPEYMNFMFNSNSDLMTYVNTDGNFEGADTAADFYKRNLRIFANFNRLDITQEDRVLVLYGAAHVAFFHDFMNRSHKYEVVDAQEYLKD